MTQSYQDIIEQAKQRGAVAPEKRGLCQMFMTGWAKANSLMTDIIGTPQKPNVGTLVGVASAAVSTEVASAVILNQKGIETLPSKLHELMTNGAVHSPTWFSQVTDAYLTHKPAMIAFVEKMGENSVNPSQVLMCGLVAVGSGLIAKEAYKFSKKPIRSVLPTLSM